MPSHLRLPRLAFTSLCICFSLLVACAQQPPAPPIGNVQQKVTWRGAGEDWATFMGPQGNGKSGETGIDPSLWNPHPPIIWDLPLGVSYGGPTVVGQALYQFDRVGESEQLTCYDVLTAVPKWTWRSPPVIYRDMYGYNNGPRCSPVVDGNLIFLYGVTGILYCVDAEKQDLLWSKNTFREYGVIPNFFGVASNPVVFGDKLLVMVGGSPAESQSLKTEQLAQVKPNGTAIVALDKRTGQELYRVGDDLASYASLTVQEINGQPTGLALLRGGLLAWQPDDGRSIFQFPWRADFLESVNAAVPVTNGQQVLISEAYQVGSTLFDANSSPWTTVWQDTGSRNRLNFRAHWATPTLIDGYLYGCNGRNPEDSDFRCVRWADGNVQWVDRRHERSSLIAVDGYLIVLGEYGRLDLMKPNSEKLELVATVELGDVSASDGRPLMEYPCWAPPVLSHGLLYIRGKDRLVCLQVMK